MLGISLNNLRISLKKLGRFLNDLGFTLEFAEEIKKVPILYFIYLIFLTVYSTLLDTEHRHAVLWGGGSVFSLTQKKEAHLHYRQNVNSANKSTYSSMHGDLNTFGITNTGGTH